MRKFLRRLGFLLLTIDIITFICFFNSVSKYVVKYNAYKYIKEGIDNNESKEEITNKIVDSSISSYLNNFYYTFYNIEDKSEESGGGYKVVAYCGYSDKIDKRSYVRSIITGKMEISPDGQWTNKPQDIITAYIMWAMIEIIFLALAILIIIKIKVSRIKYNNNMPANNAPASTIGLKLTGVLFLIIDIYLYVFLNNSVSRYTFSTSKNRIGSNVLAVVILVAFFVGAIVALFYNPNKKRKEI